MKRIALALATLLLFCVCASAADGEMKPVKSSLIEQAGYDAESRTFAVQMHNSSDTYYYADVPASLYESFLAADSKGAFYVKNIKGKFKTTRK